MKPPMPLRPRGAAKPATAAVAVVALLLAGCAAQLAPAYDQTLVNGLNQVNKDAMRLLASVSGGVAKDTFPAREPQYSEVIGEVDALAHLVRARPVPESGVVNTLRKTFGRIPEQPKVAPTLAALGTLSTTLVQMKTDDQRAGLSAYKVKGYKRQVDISLGQALGFESFLAP